MDRALTLLNFLLQHSVAAEHRGYVNNDDDTATGEHFNQPGHSLSDMTLTVLERVKSSDDIYRKEREKYFIRKFNTYYKGLNRTP